MKKMKYLCIFLLFAMGCSPSSLEDFHHEGEAICRELVMDLKKIQNREQLVKAGPLLKKQFEKLVEIMIEAREFQIKHPEEELALQPLEENSVSELLKEELKRIYAIEGGKEVVEKLQREPMLRLDAFEKMVAKQKMLRSK